MSLLMGSRMASMIRWFDPKSKNDHGPSHLAFSFSLTSGAFWNIRSFMRSRNSFEIAEVMHVCLVLTLYETDRQDFLF